MDKETASLGHVSLRNGSCIAYIERPGGQVPLVLLHGITDSARTFEPLLAGIDDRCHVYALDFRGHGDSSKPDTLYDTDAYADDVRYFIEEKIGGPALVVGHSLGGAVAVQLGVTAPTLVSGLCLEDPPLYFVNDLNEIYRALFNAIVGVATTLQDGSLSEDHWFEVMANAPDPYTGRPGIEKTGEEGIRLRLESIAMMKPKAMEDALAGSLEWNTDQVLERLQCPVTMITGNSELGAVISVEESSRVETLVNDCRVTNLNEVGHLIHDEKPEEWLAWLNASVEHLT